MKGNEYRQLPRINTNMPLKVDILLNGKSSGRTVVCTSDNISAGGIRLFSDDPIGVGALVSMVFVMPREVSHWPPLPYEFMGKVLRVDPVGGLEVKFGIAAQFIALRCQGAMRVSTEAGGNARKAIQA